MRGAATAWPSRFWGLVLGFGSLTLLSLAMSACGGSGNATESGAGPAPGGFYSGETSDDQPVLLHVSADGRGGFFELNFRAMGDCGADGSTPAGGLERVRISETGEVIAAPLPGEGSHVSDYGLKAEGGVLGRFVSESRVEGDLGRGTNAQEGFPNCTIHVGKWEAELERPGSHAPSSQERSVAKQLKVQAREVRCSWEGLVPDRFGQLMPVHGCQPYGRPQGRCYDNDGNDVTDQVRRSADAGAFFCDD